MNEWAKWAGPPKKTNEIKLIFNLFDWFCFCGELAAFGGLGWLTCRGAGYGRLAANGSAQGKTSPTKQTTNKARRNEREWSEFNGMKWICWKEWNKWTPMELKNGMDGPPAKGAA